MKKHLSLLFGVGTLMLLLAVGCASNTVTTNSAPKNTNAPVAQSVTVTITIDMGNASPVRTFQQSVPVGTTALAVLQQVGTANNIQIVTTHYDIGDLVSSINGLAATESKFWIFLVNGTEASTGAGAYQVQAGDTIGFRYGSGG